MYAAPGYSASLAAPPGTRIGNATNGFVPELDPVGGPGFLVARFAVTREPVGNEDPAPGMP